MAGDLYLNNVLVREGEWPGSLIVEIDIEEVTKYAKDGKVVVLFQRFKGLKPTDLRSHHVKLLDQSFKPVRDKKERSLKVASELDSMPIIELPF